MHIRDKHRWLENAWHECADEALIPLGDFNDGEDDEWEETPDKKKAVVIHPKAYYIKKAQKRNKRNKAASKSRKINRGKK